MTPPPAPRDCRSAFKATVDAHEKSKLPQKIGGLTAIAFIGLCIFAPKYAAVWIAGFVLSMGAAVAGSFMMGVNLICPACAKNVDKADPDGNKGCFCPDCGGESIKPSGSPLIPDTCLSCGKILLRGKSGRGYKIRFCRKCGAHLDDKGI